MTTVHAWVEINGIRVSATKSAREVYLHDTLALDVDRGNDIGDIEKRELTFSLMIPARADNPLKIGAHVVATVDSNEVFWGYVTAFEYRVVPENSAVKKDPYARQRVSATVTAVDPAYKFANIKAPKWESTSDFTVGYAIQKLEEHLKGEEKPLDISVPSYTGDLSQPHLQIPLIQAKVFDGSPVLEALQKIARVLGRRIFFTNTKPDRVELHEFRQMRDDAQVIPAAAAESSDVWSSSIDDVPNRTEIGYFERFDNEELGGRTWFINRTAVENTVTRRIEVATTDRDAMRELVIYTHNRPQPAVNLRNVRIFWTKAAAAHGPFGDVSLGRILTWPRETLAILGVVAPIPELSNLGGVVSKARLVVNPSPTASGLRRAEIEVTLHSGDVMPSGDWPAIPEKWSEFPPETKWQYAKYPPTWYRYRMSPGLGGVPLT